MSTYAVPRGLTGFESVKAFQQYEAHGVTGILCGAADMWSKKHILQCTVPRVYVWFMVENIQAGSEYLHPTSVSDQLRIDRYCEPACHL